jgi:Polysaccharide deacetylase
MALDLPAIVTDTARQPWSRRRFLGSAVGVAALGSFATACGASPHHPSSTHLLSRPTTPAGRGQSTAGASEVDAELISNRYGLKPFAPAPPPPAIKPIALSTSDPTVFSHVPLTDKVVFVTIDDGLEKEPAFIQMVKDLRVPIALELADLFIKDDYAFFEKLYETGYVTIHNHTISHPLSMPSLSAAQQLHEISGQQQILRQRYGVTPRIFRPPGGNYNETTIAAAGQSGLGGFMLWREAMQISDMQYQTTVHSLKPGDIVLCHFRGPAQLDGETMVRMMTRLYRHIQHQGFTIADITHYA